ncbi:MAG TPA: ferredoxin family protein [Pirellulales bacterium]
MIASPPTPRVYFYVGPYSAPLAPEIQSTILSRLLQQGTAVAVTHDHRPSHDGVMLGNFAGQIPADLEGDVRDIAGQSPDDVLATLAAPAPQTATPPRRWKPWFPVIDFNRCTNCMQCLSFCLFDVYGVTNDGKIQVQNESNCKTDCPACSRVCPEVAIMFPKYKAGPINGDEVNAEDLRREAMKVDISALLGGDIYSMLRDRSEKAKSRFSRERDDERALKERQRCLDKLKGAAAAFEVPPEVLAALPSADQIQFKAEQARRRAQKALELQASGESRRVGIAHQESTVGNAHPTQTDSGFQTPEGAS